MEPFKELSCSHGVGQQLTKASLKGPGFILSAPPAHSEHPCSALGFPISSSQILILLVNSRLSYKNPVSLVPTGCPASTDPTSAKSP